MNILKRLACGLSGRAYLLANRFAWERFPHAGFHQDRVYQRLMLELVASCGVTSFVETGTYKGRTTEFMAEHAPGLPIHSIEIDRNYHLEAAALMAAYPWVQLAHGSSAPWLAALLAGGGLGDLPLFFLDAHWYDDWPLPAEVELIAQQAGPCLIVIDDFQVPGRTDFKFDTYGGRSCNLDLIRPCLGPAGRHRFVFPNYSCRAALGMPHLERFFTGWVIVFQDLDGLFEDFIARPSVAGVVTVRSNA